MNSRLVKHTASNHIMSSGNSGAGGTNIWQLMNYPVPRGCAAPSALPRRPR